MHEAISRKIESDPRIDFKDRLDAILYTEVRVENIRTFADYALEELVVLNESVVSTFQAEHKESDHYAGTELEDRAYAAYGLENINSILTRITAVQDSIYRISADVSESLEKTDILITPPDQSDSPFNGNGNTPYEAPKYLDRLITLAYILERDFDIEQSDVKYTSGITTNDMLRNEPYVRVEIDDLNRLVYVCDEAGNASYVFDTMVLEQLGISVAELDNMSKNSRNALLRVTPTAGKRIVQSSKWRNIMSTALAQPFGEDESNQTETKTGPARRSEFAERPKPLEFADFLVEVREVYEDDGLPKNVVSWYRTEHKSHPGWPSNPNQTYKDKGWESWPALVGKERIKFTEFLVEVKNTYEEAGSPGNVQRWYKHEQEKHPKWPNNPNRVYKDEGWESWPALVGKETVKHLEFADFLVEVREVYEKAGLPENVVAWYRVEQKNHPGWPSNPDMVYQDEGWEGWPALVGKETVRPLGFADFLVEVREVYEDGGLPKNAVSWYRIEQKKRPGWPSNPNQTYKDKGWESWLAMVEKETIKFLEFADFLVEVRDAYEKAGPQENVAAWYRVERKKHLGWPGSPHTVYKSKGWEGFLALVRKDK